MNWKDKTIQVLIFVAILAFIAVSIGVRNNDETTIKDWAMEQDYIVDSIESTILDNGPFWIRDEDDRFYKVKVKTNNTIKTYYFRFRWYGHECKELICLKKLILNCRNLPTDNLLLKSRSCKMN